MSTSATTAKLDAALLALQSEIKMVVRNRGVEVEGKTSKFASRYATLGALCEASRPLMVKHRITIWQGGRFDEKGGERLITRLSHEGEFIDSDFPIRAREGAQNFGGGVAFARRWGWACALGLVSADDADEAQGYRSERPAKPSARRAPAELGTALASIRDATNGAELLERANAARGAYPVAEPSVAVERAIVAWFVDACSAITTPAQYEDLRTIARSVRPRGQEALSALQEAGRRVGAK